MKKTSLLLCTMFLFSLLNAPDFVKANTNTTRVSLAHDGQQANKSVEWPDISDNGRYAVFASAADNLLPESISGGKFQIFLRDLQTNSLTLVSKGIGDVPANADSYYPAISGNGRYIAFASIATNLVVGDTNSTTDIFVYDRVADNMALVSKATDGSLGNSISWAVAISDDGAVVVFESYASNLVADDTNGVKDIFAHHVPTGETTRVSVDDAGEQATEQSMEPHISGNGRYVVFTSQATLTGDINRTSAIFVYDRTAEAVERISPVVAGSISNGNVNDGFISDDGRYVSYASVAHNIVPDDTNGTYDIFRFDRETNTTRRVSVDSNGVEADGLSQALGISGNGRYILFSSDATNLVQDDTNNTYDVFVYDGLTAETTRISIPADGGNANNGSSGPAALSDEGQFIIYQSTANNLVDNDTNARIDVFMRDQGDIVGPLTSNIQVDPNPSTFGQPAAITATVDETATGTANIASAEYRVNNGSWQPMAAADGTFDSTIEDVVITLPNGLNAAGTVPVCVRGQDALGNDGPATCEDATVNNSLITLTITRITNHSVDLDSLSEPDFYVQTWIAPPDLSASTPPTFNNEDDHTNDTASVEPFWTFSNNVNQFSLRTVAIEVWDDDGLDPDDLADVNPAARKEAVVFSIDMTTGKWSGDVDWPQNCSRGQGDDAVEVCWEISTLSANGDADGDGLHDNWEKYGYNPDGDDDIDVNLPLMGADPLHKDIFVEIDYMDNSATGGRNYQPLPNAIETIVESFDNAPVPNPDGTTGIHLHVDYGEEAPLTWGAANTWGSLSQADVIPYQSHFGTCQTDKNGDVIYEWDSVDALKPTTFNSGRGDIFHYNLWVDQICPEKPKTLGISRGIEASDFIVSLHDQQWEFTHSGVFMHELGHNLGLRHGGADDINHKPNYLSVMNYSYTTRGLEINDEGWIYDFSRYDFPTLDERNLDETVGLNPPGSVTDTFRIRRFCSFDGSRYAQNAETAVDWNCDGDTTDTNVTWDVNDEYPNQPQLLTSQTDWDKLIYTGGVVGAFATENPLPRTSPVDDITEDDVIRPTGLDGQFIPFFKIS